MPGARIAISRSARRNHEARRQKALITGGNSGIGLATARLFISEGAEVAISGRDQQTLDEAVAELGSKAHGYRADITVADSSRWRDPSPQTLHREDSRERSVPGATKISHLEARGARQCHGEESQKFPTSSLPRFHFPVGRAGRSGQGCAFSCLGRFVVHQRGRADGGWRTDGRSLRSPHSSRLTVETSYEGRTAGLLDKAWVFTLRWNLNLKEEGHGTRDHPRRTVRHQF